jgi:acyl carrier protein
MEIQNFIKAFAEQFEETDVNTINVNTKYKELPEWSSLLALSVIAMIDEEYDVRIKGEDIRHMDTVEDLFNVVKNRK